MSFQTIEVQSDGAIATVTINRPKVLNALNATVIEELGCAFETFKAQKDLRCVLLTGAGEKAFAAGADIVAMAAMGSEESRGLSHAASKMGNAMETLPVPIIAVVGGYALGGGLELALCADFIYASSKAKVGLPEATLAVVPGFGGLRRLRDRVGVAMARELVYTGRIVDAQEAVRIGLVNKVFEPESLWEAAQACALEIAKNGPLAIAEAKGCFLRGGDLTLDEALVLESEAFARSFATADQKEGMAAFLQKRKATFTGT